MTTNLPPDPTPCETRRHIHYCKDFKSPSGVCGDRKYCECECGARARLRRVPSDQSEWMTAAAWDAKEAAK